MELKRLDKSVLKLWYIHAAILSLLPLGIFITAAIILGAVGAEEKMTLAVLLGVGVPAFLILSLILVMPLLRFKMFLWGYDNKRIVVRQGVVFRRKVVIPICQIQDLHRTQGPIMILMKLSDVTISTAGSNFDLSTLKNEEAEKMIDELEGYLESRIEERKSEEI